MRIGLHDGDGQTDFPNFALMKISAYHKAQGDHVEWWSPMFHYDRVYSSKVFTFTPKNLYLPPETIRGGHRIRIVQRPPGRNRRNVP